MNVHRLRYHESSFWKEPREFSHGPFEPAATRARQHIWCRRRSFFCFVFFCVCTDTKRERGLNETEGKERITKTARAYLLGASQLSSGMASPHQHQSIISTSCWDRKVCRSFERAHSSGSSWSHAHYSHTHTHSRTDASIWNIISSARLCWSAAIKGFSSSSKKLSSLRLVWLVIFTWTCSALPPDSPLIHYLALVGPVDIETFWVHLHGHRGCLCGVLDGDGWR